MKVRVVTDSTADLPPGLAQELGITVVPLYVHFGTEVFRDGIDLGADEFYRRLASSPTLPTTSAPSPGDFAQTYDRLAREADAIVSIHISSKLSATHGSALLGEEQHQSQACRIEVIDSLQVSMALGLLAIEAARMAQKGTAIDEILSWLRRALPHTHLFGLLDTLEYLHKGGRIGRAQAFLGSLLHVKPIIEVREGQVFPLERARSRSKGIERLIEQAASFKGIEALSVIHSTGAGEAEALRQRLGHLFPPEKAHLARFGPVLGTYVGPGTLAIALIARE